MASPNDDRVVKGGYWYCDNKLPTPVASIPSNNFTHLFAAFAEVNPTTYEVTFPEEHREQFSTFTLTVQGINPDVTTLLSIGETGVSTTSTFASLASHFNTRKSFINSSISLARSYDFHGLSLHWLYPSTKEEMANLGSLLLEWGAAVKHESELTGNDKLLLVAAVYYRPTYRTFLYPVDAIAGSLDWINLVAYDFYNPALSWNATGPFAALYNGHIHEIIPRSADHGIIEWSQSKVTATRIVLGLPFYGAAWLLDLDIDLEDSTRTDIFAPAEGPADGQADGVYVDPSDGTILYNQIKYFEERHPEGIQEYSADYVVDYFSAENIWIGYDDIKSITAKVKDAKNEFKLLGYYAWHVGGDRQGILSITG
ncbi:class V chitinase-like [Corylus avellana]|uniref:class V chitinase-like n=1 Tax=Corylus avellana TaxID=13451 RepID=UPI00286B53EB|nr:class V chitinase-like [Corylus avellana]